MEETLNIPLFFISGSIKGGTYSNGMYSESRPSDLASLATMLDDSVHIDEKYNIKIKILSIICLHKINNVI